MKQKWKTEKIILLETQCDDITGQEAGYLIQRLIEKGALDALCIPAIMKKGRPGFLLQVLCKTENKTEMTELMFDETPTLGIREQILSRKILPRSNATYLTPHGFVRSKKRFWRGRTESIPEFDDLARLAEKKKVPFSRLKRVVIPQFHPPVK